MEHRFSFSFSTAIHIKPKRITGEPLESLNTFKNMLKAFDHFYVSFRPNNFWTLLKKSYQPWKQFWENLFNFEIMLHFLNFQKPAKFQRISEKRRRNFAQEKDKKFVTNFFPAIIFIELTDINQRMNATNSANSFPTQSKNVKVFASWQKPSTKNTKQRNIGKMSDKTHNIPGNWPQIIEWY